MSALRISIDRLEEFGTAIFEAVGIDREHAAITARRIVEADMRGRTGHGIIRIGPYVARIEAGGVNLKPNIRVTHETAASAQMEGDNGLGQVVMTRATDLAIEKAKNVGMAWVGTVHSNHAGAAGIYPLMAAREGLIAIYVAVANANGMPPWGGQDRLLGTNPISIGVPNGDGTPFILDIATTVASHGTIKVAAQAGEKMPVGWVVDVDGEPITDPTRAHEGYLVPIGGYKGSGLNIAIGLLAGVMNGAAFGDSVIDHRVELTSPTNTGQSIFVLRPDLFMSKSDFFKSVDQHLDELRGSRPDGAEVRLPGDRAAQIEAENKSRGVPVPAPLLDQLNGLASRLHVSPLENDDA